MQAPKARNIQCLVAALGWLAGSAAASAQTDVLSEEPPPGALKAGVTVYVDDGRCPKGKIKEVAGGDNIGARHGSTSRTRRCVRRPM